MTILIHLGLKSTNIEEHLIVIVRNIILYNISNYQIIALFELLLIPYGIKRGRNLVQTLAEKKG